MSRKHEQTDSEHDGAESTPEQGVQAELEQIQRELEDANEKYLRALADFQNFQRRAGQNEVAARDAGASGVIKSVLAVMDYFDLALSQDPEKATATSILQGVQMIRGELLKALTQHGVALIEPKPGDEMNAALHEAVGTAPAEGVEPGHVAAALQPGYRVGERVLRPAKVMIAAADTNDQQDG